MIVFVLLEVVALKSYTKTLVKSRLSFDQELKLRSPPGRRNPRPFFLEVKWTIRPERM
jgi:hypothetical protein